MNMSHEFNANNRFDVKINEWSIVLTLTGPPTGLSSSSEHRRTDLHVCHGLSLAYRTKVSITNIK